MGNVSYAHLDKSRCMDSRPGYYYNLRGLELEHGDIFQDDLDRAGWCGPYRTEAEAQKHRNTFLRAYHNHKTDTWEYVPEFYVPAFRAMGYYTRGVYVDHLPPWWGGPVDPPGKETVCSPET